MKFTIRTERKEDYQSIQNVNDLAFGQKNEGKLIGKLRMTKSFISELSLVAESENKIVGHILFYPVHIRSEEDSHISLALAPMAVHPDYQRKGIGSRLILEGLSSAKGLGYDSVIVLGHPEFYAMFGFQPASAWNIKAPFDVPGNAFLAVELIDSSLKNVSGTVEYPEEFNVCD